MDQALKQEDMPSGGIADFIYTDEEIKLLEDKELKDLYGQSGIAQFKTIGKEMANFGRYGDDTIAHVETGELIVPRALIESNPKLKESIFGHLRDLGIDDPERYVVGTSKNSLNPETGLPEFFLKKLFKGVKKTVSSIGKGVSKALSGVGKALKKVAPIVLPIALAMTPLGPIYGAALGSGIGTLVQGGSVEDAFKSALVAGASGAVFKGVGSSLSGGTFTGGVSEALANPGARFSDLGQRITSLESPFGSFQPTSSTELAKEGASLDTVDVKSGDVYTSADDIIPKERSVTQRIGDYMFRGGESPADIARMKSLAKTDAINNVLKEYNVASLKDAPLLVQQEAIAAGKAAAGEAGPGFLTKFGPTAALGVAGLAGLGAFKTPEDEALPEVRTGYDVYQENPDKFNVQNVDVRSAEGPFQTDTSYGFQYNPYLFSGTPFQTAADGGEIFPRRNGGIGPREGTPGKDSVRAMLMPGEFVMTTNAVKGLGDGNLDKGIKNMYSVMSKLEKRGKAMA